MNAPTSSPRPLSRGVTHQQLAQLCYRGSTSLDAGIDVRRFWQGEAQRARGRTAQVYQAIAESVAQGDSLGEAIASWDGFFPELFVTLVGIGETTGTTPAVLRRLADHYEHRVQVARDFRLQIAWPLFQLMIALVVVGVMILIAGVLQDERGRPIDLLGLGLIGTEGLVTYGATLGTLVLALLVGLRWAKRRPALGAWLLAKGVAIPVLGNALQKIALARIAWGLHLTMNTEIDLRKMAPLVLRLSGNAHYACHGHQVAKSIEEGNPLSLALAQTEVFPRRFLDALEVAEEGGQIVESMARLSQQYEEESEHAFATLSHLLGLLVWGAIATLIVLLIFRVFGFYTGMINDALNEL